MIRKVVFKLFFIFSLTCIGQANAQEVLFPLTENPVIKQYLKTHVISDDAAYRVQSVTDTITLPFREDFSGRGIYPVDTNWIDSSAFINSTFCFMPVTIGVATLDGINKYGNPYDPLSGASDTADFLTSKYIKFSSPTYDPLNPLDTTIWFSFYYQPQGLGDEPETEDSLTLQFKNSHGVWNEVWSTPGHANMAFQRVNIHLTDSSYLYDGFQFRFMNYATQNGNRDHWNIDYVYLDNDRSNNDSLNEITFVNPIKSYLNEFTAMPYSHYKYTVAQGNNPIRSVISDTIRCFRIPGLQTGITARHTITDENGNVVLPVVTFSSPLSPIAGQQNSFIGISDPLPSAVFTPTLSSEFADFFIKHFFTATFAGLKTNDESNFIQHFQNYYAYDDGTAETAYGIPEAGAKIAYRFNVKMQDTLIGVQIYFNQVGQVVHNNLFQLCYWSDINVTANTDNLVYNMTDNHPANIDSINGFATYVFDTPQIVNANTNIWVGWIQNDATQLGIGVDKNTIATSNMFTKFTSGGILKWRQSIIQGSWMMRPIFKSSLNVGINEQEASAFFFNVYPNPASTEAFIDIRVENKQRYEYDLFNNLGENVLHGNAASEKINISHPPLADGFYFVRLTDKNTEESVTKKLVIQHY